MSWHFEMIGAQFIRGHASSNVLELNITIRIAIEIQAKTNFRPSGLF